MSERIYDAGHDIDPDHVMHVEVDSAGNLGLVVVDGENQATLKIDQKGAKKLRLALQRYERQAT